MDRQHVLPVLVAGLALALNPLAAHAGFVGPSAITIDGAFTDWTGNVYSQTNAYTPNGSRGASHITKVWYAMSTANGTSPAGAANLIQNVYFRFDTAGSSANNPKQAYWVQLNLGTAPIGFADHVLQFYVDTTATPGVAIVLYQYSAPYPAIKVFTTTAFSPKVSNLSSGYGTHDTNAVGAWAQNGTTYSFEAKIPIGWYSPVYGGAISAYGTGADMIASAVFTSTGSLGAKGTAQDNVADVNGNLYYTQVNASTGGSSFVPANPNGGSYSATAAAATLTPVAGAADSTTLTVFKADGTTTDTLYTGAHNIILSGFLAAPDATYGSFNGVTLTGSPQTISVNFVNGVATVPLALKDAATQVIGFSLPDLTFQAANSLTNSPTAGSATKLAFNSLPVTATAGQASGAITVQRQDAYGNPNTTDASRTVTLSSDSPGTRTFTPASPLTISSGSSTASFTYTDTKSGNPTISAASTSPTTITLATQPETVNPAAPSRVVFTTQPGNGTDCSPLSTQPGVTLEDQYGNTVTGTPQNVTVAIQNNVRGGRLSGTTTAPVNTGTGVATFSGLSIDRVGTGYTLTATGSTLNTTPGVAVSSGFNITPTAAGALSLDNSFSSMGNSVTVTFAGIPGYNYVVERTSDLKHGPWTAITGSATTAPTSGLWTFIDASPPNPSYYRLRQNK
jgi:hypothetical protein